MKFRSLLIVLLLLSPSAASAVPISPAGLWLPVTNVNGDQIPYWDGLSWDCQYCGAGYLLTGPMGLVGLEYLHAVTGESAPFRFDDVNIETEVIYNYTAWNEGKFGRDASGAFTYDSNTGHRSNSWTSPQQYVLFRLVLADATVYYLGIEDILVTERPNDLDYNDYGVKFTIPRQTVPEPATLLLMGVSLVGLAAQRLRSPKRSPSRFQ